jgi:hypothetical protein
MYLVN